MFGFFETPERLAHKARHLGLDLDGPLKRRHLEIVWQPGTETLLDELGHRLIDAVKKTNAKRVFVDGLQTFMDAAYRPERISHFFTALTNEFRVRGVTSVYTLEAANPISQEVRLPIQNISSVAENIILLRFVEWKAQLHRVLSVLKMRDSDHDKRLREFIISSRGIRLAPSFSSAEQIMSGFARARPAGTSRKSPGGGRAR